MTEKKRSFYRNIGIGIGISVVVIIVFIALNAIFTTPTATPAPTKPEYVMVSGTANNTDRLSYADPTVTPIMVIFTSMRNNNTYEARFNGEHYSISLPNNNSYNVTISWQFTTVYAGDAHAGTFNLNTTETAITKNWTSPYQYPLKPEQVTVHGTATYTGATGYPDPKGVTPNIIFFTSLRNGSTYWTRFSDEFYSISLPNRDSYHVTINWQFNIIYAGDIQAGTFNLDTIETAITKNWACPNQHG